MKKAKKKVSKSELRKAIRALLKLYGIRPIPYVPGFYGEKGVSDLLCCGTVENVPGKFIAIEVKTVNDKPSPEQLEFVKDINQRGGIAFFAQSTEDVIRALNLPVLF